MTKLLQTNTYFEPCECEACHRATNWGEVISCKTFLRGDLKTLGYRFICPECYKKVLFFIARR